MEIIILDWLLNKPLKVQIPENIEIKPGQRLICRDNETKRIFCGQYLGYQCDTIKTAEFKYILEGNKQEQFLKKQQKAKSLLKTFKKEFKKYFPSSVPLTAKHPFYGNSVYFYFYAEDRFDFKQFIPHFRKVIGGTFFLFQVGARERIRLDPAADCTFGTCGQMLCCKRGLHPLPSVDSDNISLQNIENRGIENLKGRCNKLKCCLNYERDVYEEETEKYPNKGDKFVYKEKEFTCCSVNIMTGDIVGKSNDEDKQTIKLNIDEL